MRVMALRQQVEEQRVYAVDFRTGDNITAMPRDIMVKIFSYLNVQDVPTLSLVCKQWKRSTTEPALWKHYTLTRWAAKIQWSIVDEVRGKHTRTQAGIQARATPSDLTRCTHMPVWQRRDAFGVLCSVADHWRLPGRVRLAAALP